MQLLTVLSENWNLVRLFLISSVQSKINACAIFFAHSRERSTSYYNLQEILNLDDMAKSKTVVFTHLRIFIELTFAQTTAILFRYEAVQVWESVPSHVKSLTEPAFRKQYKIFLLSSQ